MKKKKKRKKKRRNYSSSPQLLLKEFRLLCSSSRDKVLHLGQVPDLGQLPRVLLSLKNASLGSQISDSLFKSAFSISVALVMLFATVEKSVFAVDLYIYI